MRLHSLFMFIVCLSVLMSDASAQSFSDYKWKNDMPQAPDIPEEFADADAVIINNETYSRGVFSGTFPRIEQLATYRTQVHVKILSEDALADYSRINVQKFRGRIADYIQYKNVDVRVRKKDGSIKSYDVNDLEKVTLTEDDDLFDNRDNISVYEIPGLEVGDELEQVTVIESKFLDRGRIVNLYGQYPTLKASFTISVPLKVGLDGSIYNGMPKPDFRKTSTNRIYEWTMTNLKAVPEANSTGTVFTKDLEYFVYELNFDAYRSDPLAFTVQNWSDLMWQYSEDFLRVRVRKKRKLNDFYEQLFANGAKLLKKKPEELSKLEKVYFLNEYIAKEMQLIGELEDFEKSEGIDYFLINGKTDYRNLMRIYRDFFERFEIEYYLALGKSRFNGAIDQTFVSSTQINNYFFVFKVKEGLFTITGTGCLNELPWNLQNTTCLMKDITDRKTKLQEISFQEVELKNEQNKRFRRAQVQINLNENQVQKKVSSSFAGLYARSGRDWLMGGYKADTLNKSLLRSYKNTYRNDEDIDVMVKDARVSQFLTMQPFDFKYGYNATLTNLLKKEGDQWKLPIDHFLSHRARWVTNAENRQLDYHVPYLGMDIEDIYLVFNENVEIANADKLNRKVETEYGSYEFEVVQMKPNMIRVQSTYETKTLFIPHDKVKEFDKINDALEEVLDASFMIKKK